jgi:predicted aconitase with swiveling domain
VKLPVRPLTPGTASGAPLRLREPLSFWGGFDAETGAIVDVRHPQRGEVLSGRVLLMPAGRGSSSGSALLAEALRLGTAPVAIVLGRVDEIIALGAVVGEEIYGRSCPVVSVEGELPELGAATTATVRSAPDTGRGELELG